MYNHTCKLCGADTDSLSGLCCRCACKVAKFALRNKGYSAILKKLEACRCHMLNNHERQRKRNNARSDNADWLAATQAF
eukprot:11175322-Ditylum_brightwellii.AAC.1